MPLDVHRYERDGYVFPIPILDPAEADELRQHVTGLQATANSPVERLPGPHIFFPWAFEAATRPKLLDHVESILGPDILLWGTLILSKNPDSGSFVPWHQDSAHTAFLNGSRSLTAWIALTPATPQSGCMRVIPGSHHRQLPFTSTQRPGDMLSRGLEVTAEIDEEEAVDLILWPGEASLHDNGLLHGSNQNHSTLPRIGFIARFATPAMSQPEYPVHCARGNSGRVVCAPPPADDGPFVLRAWSDYVDRANRKDAAAG
jgi:non-haem Fe2+, alpha-ketoglutarate-dependent halogenase